MKRKVAVIGGGAAGMMSAAAAARAGAEVTIYEHNDCLGKKLLQTGNGKCNFTNVSMDAGHYHTSGDIGQIADALERFGHEEAISFFGGLGIYTRNRRGGIYPYPETASSVLDVLKMELKKQGVNTMLKCGRVSVGRDRTVNGRHFDAVVTASGGCAAKNTGSDGSGYELAEKLGIALVKPYPALSPLITAQELSDLSGIRCEAGLKLLDDGRECASSYGELQPYSGGLSGICALDLASRAAEVLSSGHRAEVECDFFPDFDDAVFRQFVGYRMKQFPERNINEIFTGMFCKKLTGFLLNGTDCRKSTFMDDLIKNVKHHVFLLSDEQCRDFSRAQTSSGGVALCELDRNMMLVKAPGIYIAGELMDVDGVCGGYNLQWAWTSGFIAGTSAGNGE